MHMQTAKSTSPVELIPPRDSFFVVTCGSSRTRASSIQLSRCRMAGHDGACAGIWSMAATVARTGGRREAERCDFRDSFYGPAPHLHPAVSTAGVVRDVAESQGLETVATS